MDDPKLDAINMNLTHFFTDIVDFIQSFWKFLKTFFKVKEDEDPSKPLYKE